MSKARLNLHLPPAIVLGGDANALSIARALAFAGVSVYAINHPQEVVRYCRFCKWIKVPDAATPEQGWAAYLLGRESDHLRGAVLLAASDEAIELITNNRQPLSEKFTLDLSNPAAQLCMLDKLRTYQAAQAAGVPTPKFWVAETREQIKNLRGQLVFPLIVKPLLGHDFKRKFTGSFIVVNRFDELLETFDAVDNAGIRTFLVEMMPGPDTRLCSYYTYIAENGDSLFDFTKRVIRRFPMNVGMGCYHMSDYVPEVKELSLKLFRQVGLRGIANAEFKLDERDGQLKLIECNARFTAADCLLAASGVNLPLFVYQRLIGRAQPAPSTYRAGLRLWDPIQDFRAFRQLNSKGLITFREWVRSIIHPQVFPMFRLYDPLPALVYCAQQLKRYLSRHPRLPRSVRLPLEGGKKSKPTFSKTGASSAPGPCC